MLDAVVDYLPSPLDVPPMMGHDVRRRGDGDHPQAGLRPSRSRPWPSRSPRTRSSASSPTSGSTPVTWLPAPGSSTRPRAEGAHRQAVPDARQQGEPGRGRHRGPHLRDDRPEGHHDRRHPVRPERPGRARVDDLPGRRSSRWPSSRRPRATRRSSAPRSRSWPRRTRPSRSHQDEETGQTIIAGMGELHLDILVDRMRREFKVEANVGKPQVAYRETIRRAVREVRLHPQEADRWLGPVREGPGRPSSRWTPRTARCYEFVNKVTGGRIPREYIPSVDHGIQDAMQLGVLAGYPLVGHQGDPARRCGARRRLLGDGVQDRRLDGAQGGRPQGRPRAARAGHGRRGPYARGLHGRRHRRPELPPRPDPVDGGRQRRQGRPGARAAVGDVRLRWRPAVARPRVARTTRMQFDSYAEVPRNVTEEIIKKARGE